MEIRVMQIEDYDKVISLWHGADGVGVGVDDSKENIGRYLQKNPSTSFVALDGEQIIGAIMAGHDGYRGFIHHTAVAEAYRGQKIGSQLVIKVLQALREEKINKVVLVVFKANELGNLFWEKQGFAKREDLYYRDLRLGKELSQ